MSGINPARALIDKILGYDDGYQSTEDSRQLNWVIWNSANARPDLIIQLYGGKLVIRPARNEAEYFTSKIVAATLRNMRNPKQK